MIRFVRTVRLLPIVIIAAVSLFALKVSGLLFDGGYTLGERLAQRGKPQMTITTADSVPAYPKIVFGRRQDPAGGGLQTVAKQQPAVLGRADVQLRQRQSATSPVRCRNRKTKARSSRSATSRRRPTKLEASGPDPMIGAGRIAFAGEQAILERLQQRRKELDKPHPRPRNAREPAQGRGKTGRGPGERAQGTGKEGQCRDRPPRQGPEADTSRAWSPCMRRCGRRTPPASSTGSISASWSRSPPG